MIERSIFSQNGGHFKTSLLGGNLGRVLENYLEVYIAKSCRMAAHCTEKENIPLENDNLGISEERKARRRSSIGQRALVNN